MKNNIIRLAIFLVISISLGISIGLLGGQVEDTVRMDLENPATMYVSQDDSYYMLSSNEGVVTKYSLRDEKLFEVTFENTINYINKFGDNYYLVDKSRNLYVCDENLGVIKSTKLDGAFVDIFVADSQIFVAIAPKATDLYIIKYDSELNVLGRGFYYIYNEDSLSIEKAQTRTLGFTGSSNGEYLFILDDSGYIHKISTDLERLTNKEDQFLQSYFKEYVYSTEFYSYDVDKQNDILYVTTKDKKLIKVNMLDMTDVNMITIPYIGVQSTFSSEQNLFLTVGNDLNRVAVVDTNEFTYKYNFVSEFNIQSVKLSSGGERFFTVSIENDSRHVSTLNFDGLDGKELTQNIRNVLVALLIISALLSVFFIICLIKKDLYKKTLIKIKHIKNEIIKKKFIYIIMIPSVILLFMFCYYPAIASLINSFFDYSIGFPKIFNGVGNFVELFTDKTFITSIKNMVIFLVCDIFFGLIPPIIFALALATVRSKRFSTFSRLVMFLPGIIPGVSMLLIWRYGIYGDYGLVNHLLLNVFKVIEAPIPFLGSTDYAMGSLIFMGFPFVGSYLIFYGALMNVPSSYYEAAEVEGCKFFRRVISIDLPLISGQMKYVFVLSFIGSIQNIGRVMMTTDGSSGTQIPILTMFKYINQGEYGLSSAIALILFIILSIATTINLKLKTVDGGE